MINPMERNEITDHIEEYFPHDVGNILLADGFEDAFVGVIQSMGSMPKATYNYDICIEILMEDMSYEEAVEFFEFNVTGAYVGEHTPAFLTPIRK